MTHLKDPICVDLYLKDHGITLNYIKELSGPVKRVILLPKEACGPIFGTRL